ARVKVTDLTLQDVQVIRKDGLAGSGMLWVNADGAQLHGCRADDTLIVSQASDRSGRPTVIEDCEFATLAGDPVIQESVTGPVHLVRTAVHGLEGVAFAGTGPVLLDDCRLIAAEGAGEVSVAGDLTITGGRLDHVGLVAAATADQTVRLTGAQLSGTPAGAAFLRRGDGEATVNWELTGAALAATDGTDHVTLTAGSNRWSAVASRFVGGGLELAAEAVGGGDAWVRHTDNVEDGVERRAFPAAGARALVEPNLTL